MTTAARIQSSDSAHWYQQDGEPCYEVIGKSTGRPRPVNITDARARNLVPSVTTLLKVLHKEALVNWRIEQAVLACLTTPRLSSIDPATNATVEEALDAYINRVLHVEKVQEQEGQIARDKGIEIHDALEMLFSGAATPVTDELKPWIMPAYEAVIALGGKTLSTEQILVGSGYAGRTDLIVALDDNTFDIWDFKSAKKLPDPKKGGSWQEHRLQLAAYAQAFLETQFAKDAKLKAENIRTRNLYISTADQGRFVICENGSWESCFWDGFMPVLYYWQWANNFKLPVTSKAPEPVADVPQITEAAIEAAFAEAKAEETAPPPRKRKVSVDVGVPTLQQPRLSPMVPPPMPNEP